MTKALHPRAFAVTVVWTLGLLYLGSVVHATESSLACPDWPTCFGTMTPVMTGGVFWEHLHRLVAGGLMLMFGLATWLAKNETEDRPWIFRLCLAGLGLLVVQSIFGGLTVLFQLPDLVSTTHLGLALLFLVLATLLASSTGWARNVDSWDARRSSVVARFATGAAALVFVQSILGGLVRHMDAGMACPDAPLCLGQVVPPLVNTPITIHFAHRVMGVITALAIIGLASWMVRAGAPAALRTWGLLAGGLVVAQVSLGFLSVLTVLAVAPVSLHTLVAAALLSSLVHIAIMARHSARREPVEEPSMAA